MKEFRKNKQGLYICEECEKLFIKKEGLSKHISNFHKNKQIYFDKWLKDEDEELCKICGKETIFISLKGYKECCSDICTKILADKKSKKRV